MIAVGISRPRPYWARGTFHSFAFITADSLYLKEGFYGPNRNRTPGDPL